MEMPPVFERPKATIPKFSESAALISYSLWLLYHLYNLLKVTGASCHALLVVARHWWQVLGVRWRCVQVGAGVGARKSSSDLGSLHVEIKNGLRLDKED